MNNLKINDLVRFRYTQSGQTRIGRIRSFSNLSGGQSFTTVHFSSLRDGRVEVRLYPYVTKVTIDEITTEELSQISTEELLKLIKEKRDYET